MVTVDNETCCLRCQSFLLSLNGSANGDINQCADTCAEAVMKWRASWERWGWMTQCDTERDHSGRPDNCGLTGASTDQAER